MVYALGLDDEITNEEHLRKNEYFGQYGKILKMVIYKTSYNKKSNNSVYITFSNEKEASLAIYAVNGFEIHKKVIKCSYGTTK